MKVRDILISYNEQLPSPSQYAEQVSLEDHGNEAIAYQGKSALFMGLSEIFTKHIANDLSKIANDKETAKRISELTLKHSGLNVNVRFDDSYNAYAIPLILNPNHPFLQRFKSIPYKDLEKEIGLIREFKILIAKNYTEIDLKKGMIRGACSKIPFEITIGRGLWRIGKDNGEETAAIYLHELGHLFTFIERVVNVVTANLVVNTAIEALGKAKDRTEKIKVVEVVNETLGSNIDADGLINNGNRKSQEVILVTAYNEAFPSQTGVSGHEASGSEFTADQFATRHGAGTALASGLARMSGGLTVSRAGFILTQIFFFIISLLSMLLLNPLTWILVIHMVFLMDHEERVYDTPVDRLKRIRGDMIQSIKDPNMDRKTREVLMKDILLMDNLIGKAKDFQNVFQVIWKYMSSKRRKAYNDRILQQELESIINNPLFVRSAQLQQLV